MITRIVEELPEDSVVKIKVHGKISKETGEVLKAASLRDLAPSTMNVNVTLVEAMRSSEKSINSQKLEQIRKMRNEHRMV